MVTITLTQEQLNSILSQVNAGPVPTPVPTPVNIPAKADGMPNKEGVQWFSEVRFPGTTNAEKNFNWIMHWCGSPWAFSYMYASRANLTAALHAYFDKTTDPANASRIINHMGNQGRYAPDGFLVPSMPDVRYGMYKSRKPVVTFKFAFPDDNNS